MGKTDYRAAGAMVDLIKTIIRDELDKRDQVFVGTVQQRNAENDTYTIYIETDLSNGRPAVMTGIPNESKHVYAPGDHVYVMKVRGQIAQSFIIGSVGARGVSVNKLVLDANKKISSLDGMLTSVGLKSPAFRTEQTTWDDNGTERLAFKISWDGKTFFVSSLQFYCFYGSGSAYCGIGTTGTTTAPYKRNLSPTQHTASIEWSIADVDIKYINETQSFVLRTNLPASTSVSSSSVLPMGGVSLMDVGFVVG